MGENRQDQYNLTREDRVRNRRRLREATTELHTDVHKHNKEHPNRRRFIRQASFFDESTLTPPRQRDRQRRKTMASIDETQEHNSIRDNQLDSFNSRSTKHDQMVDSKARESARAQKKNYYYGNMYPEKWNSSKDERFKKLLTHRSDSKQRKLNKVEESRNVWGDRVKTNNGATRNYDVGVHSMYFRR